jgi:glycosyltransferase involved in cell wall biosynthesis
MNILVVVPWDQAAGGVVSVAGHMARYLAEQGHQIRYFTMGESNRIHRRTTSWGFPGYDLSLRSPEGAHGTVTDLAKFACLLPFSLGQLARMIRRERIELINIHYPLPGHVQFAFLRKALGLRLVTVVHGADLFPGGSAARQYPWSLRYLLDSSDRIVTPSESLRRDVQAVLPALAPKIQAILNCVDVGEFAGEAPPPPYTRNLLCIAAHNEKKAIDVLLRAFAQLRRFDGRLRLQLVGDGPLRPELERLSADLAIQDHVDFLGWRDRAGTIELLKRAEVLVVPSRAEPFGIVVLEGMVTGKPVVASAVGGIPEMVEDGRNGLLVPPDDPAALAQAIHRVLTDSALATALGEAGQATVRGRFTRDRMGAEYASLFAELLASRAHERRPGAGFPAGAG